MQDIPTRTALILGSNGRFGGAMADALWQAGWSLRLFERKTDDLMEAARGADVIVNGWNPQYHRWAEELPAQSDQVIAAAQASGARVVLAGNLYVDGADSGPVLDVDTPHLADNPLGQLRCAQEAAYRAADVPLLILRAGDFIDTEASGNWFDMVITKPLARGAIRYPGDPTAPHSWAFLPDLARAGVQLLDCDLPHQIEVPFPGYDLSGEAMAAQLSVALGRPVRCRPMAWWPLRVMRPFVPYLGGVFEMRYLWSMPHRVARGTFARLLPGFQATPPAIALARTAPVRAQTGADPSRSTRDLRRAQHCCPAQAT